VTYIQDPLELASLPSPITLIGSGTNRLWVNSQHSLLVSLKELNTLTFFNDGLVRVGAGVILPTLINESKGLRFGGLEFTWPIPATIGGAITQNFGAFNAHLGNFVRSITVFDPLTKEISVVSIDNEEDWFSYRYSRIKKEGLVLIDATLKLELIDPSDIQSDLDSIQSKRISRHPLPHTCGSVFKNPPHVPAGKLLEDCGFKWFHLGPVQTAVNHANVIIADPKATTQDIFDLIRMLQKEVHSKTGIPLELELDVY
jgi:UDP-N-acetylmuramate dehydrogenase